MSPHLATPPVLALFVLSASSALAQPGRAALATTRVSVHTSGAQAVTPCESPVISDNGRVVAFQSFAWTLVDNDTNFAEDIFVHDLNTAVTTRVSVSSSGAQSSNGSYRPSISGDGRYVAFIGFGSDLVPNDTNNQPDAFLHDRLTGATTRVSVSSAGAQGDAGSLSVVISRDGSTVAFESHANNLVPNDLNFSADIFVRHLATGVTSIVSLTSSGLHAQGLCHSPAISADGSVVAFASHADNLVPNDNNNRLDVFVRDRNTGLTSRVSVSSAGVEGNDESSQPRISSDGRYVAFRSDASNLVPNDTNSASDVFVHDRQTGQTFRVSVDSSGAQANGWSQYPSLSADGRYIAFESGASNLVPDDTNFSSDIFLRDLHSGETTRISLAHDGAQGNSSSVIPALTPDAAAVAFTSDASNLVPDDTNNTADVFVRVLALAPCPGDANGDRVVDFLDLNIVLSFFGQSVSPGTNGDLNNDGAVDFLDLNIVLSFFGTAC